MIVKTKLLVVTVAFVIAVGLVFGLHGPKPDHDRPTPYTHSPAATELYDSAVSIILGCGCGGTDATGGVCFSQEIRFADPSDTGYTYPAPGQVCFIRDGRTEWCRPSNITQPYN